MVNPIRTCGLIMLMSISMVLMQTAAAKSSARVQRQTIGISDSFQLMLTTDQDLSDAPDLQSLEQDFDILSRSKSSNLSIVNGSMSRSTTWVLDLMPKREGKLVIPPITMDKEQTNAIEINVLANAPANSGAPSSDVDLEIDLDNLNPYVQQQFILTIRVVHKVQLTEASLTEPTVTGGNVIIEKLGDDVRYESTRGQTRVGIVERRYALFAQSSEPIVIEPVRFEGRMSEFGRRGYDPFRRGRIVRKQSDTINVDIKPPPADYTGQTWLPARQLMLVENSPAGGTEYRVGEPFTRTLTIQATGLSASQLPELDLLVPDGIKQYPDQPILENQVGSDGLVASRQEKTALIPSQPGRVTLPAIEVPWWNTQTGQQEYARLPARTIEVLPGSLPAGKTAAPEPAAPPAPTVDAAAPTASVQPPVTPGIWPWISLALGIGWLLSMLGWWWSRRSGNVAASTHVAAPQTKTLLKAVKTACDEHQAANCKTALLDWAKLEWPGQNVHSLGTLAARLDGELQAQVHVLNQCLYRNEGNGWAGEKFWQAFAAYQQHPKVNPAPKPQLEPLYR